MELNNIELVKYCDAFASALNGETVLHDVERLIRHVATRLDTTNAALAHMYKCNGELQHRVDVLSVESAQAKQVISECKSYFIAGITNQIRPTNEGYLHMICDTFLDDTKTTDAALAEIRAQGRAEGVKMFAARMRKYADDEDSCNRKCSLNLTAERAENYSSWMRKEAGQ